MSDPSTSPPHGTDRFHEWRDRVESTRLNWTAGREYYHPDQSDRFITYTATVGETTYTYPVFTTPEWKTANIPLDDLVTEGSPFPPDHDDTVIDRVADRLAHRLDAPNRSVVVDDHLWNGDIYRITTSQTDDLQLTAHKTDYYTYLSTTSQLVHELLDALYTADVSPTADQTTLRTALDDITLPYRHRAAPTLDHLVTDPDDALARVAGVTMLPVFNTGDGYELVVMHRSDDVHSIPNTIGAIGGSLAPHDNEPPSLRGQLIREFAEELFSADEESSASHPAAARLRTALTNGSADLTFAALLVDGLRTNFHVRTLLFIDDPAFYRYVRASQDPNWEADRLEYISLENTNRLRDILRPKAVAPPTGPGIIESLNRLETEYGVPVPLELDPVI